MICPTPPTHTISGTESGTLARVRRCIRCSAPTLPPSCLSSAPTLLLQHPKAAPPQPPRCFNCSPLLHTAQTLPKYSLNAAHAQPTQQSPYPHTAARCCSSSHTPLTQPPLHCSEPHALVTNPQLHTAPALPLSSCTQVHTAPTPPCTALTSPLHATSTQPQCMGAPQFSALRLIIAGHATERHKRGTSHISCSDSTWPAPSGLHVVQHTPGRHSSLHCSRDTAPSQLLSNTCWSLPGFSHAT